MAKAKFLLTKASFFTLDQIEWGKYCNTYKKAYKAMEEAVAETVDEFQFRKFLAPELEEFPIETEINEFDARVDFGPWYVNYKIEELG